MPSFEDAARLCSKLKDHGFQCYVVGGAVRDMQMGRPHMTTIWQPMLRLRKYPRYSKTKRLFPPARSLAR